jgi:hypothetical protein
MCAAILGIAVLTKLEDLKFVAFHTVATVWLYKERIMAEHVLFCEGALVTFVGIMVLLLDLVYSRLVTKDRRAKVVTFKEDGPLGTSHSIEGTPKSRTGVLTVTLNGKKRCSAMISGNAWKSSPTRLPPLFDEPKDESGDFLSSSAASSPSSARGSPKGRLTRKLVTTPKSEAAIQTPARLIKAANAKKRPFGMDLRSAASAHGMELRSAKKRFRRL